MKVSREVKKSDGNFGNSTFRLEVEVKKENLLQVMALLDQWEVQLRKSSLADLDEDLSVREYKELEESKKELEQIVQRLGELSE
jgi:hypothetical protein